MRSTAEVVKEVRAARDALIRKGFSSGDVVVELTVERIAVKYPRGQVDVLPPDDVRAWHSGFVRDLVADFRSTL